MFNKSVCKQQPKNISDAGLATRTHKVNDLISLVQILALSAKRYKKKR